VKGVLKLKGTINFFCIGFVVFFCCTSGGRKPDHILGQDEMVKALSDIYLTEEKISSLSLTTDSATQVFYLMEDRIFENLQISDSIFRESLKYYMDHPSEMEKIYGALVDSLQLLEQRTNLHSAPAQ
jgi:hypothetical protein